MEAEIDLLTKKLDRLQGKEIILHYFNYSYSCDEGDDDERSDTCIKDIPVKLHGILGYEHHKKAKIAFVLAESGIKSYIKPTTKSTTKSTSTNLQVHPYGIISGSSSWVCSSRETSLLSKITRRGTVFWDGAIPQFPCPGGLGLYSSYVKELGKEISDLITDQELQKKIQALAPTLRTGEGYFLPQISTAEYCALEKYLIKIV